MIKSYTQGFDPDYQLSKSFNFSSATTPNMVQVVTSLYDKNIVFIKIMVIENFGILCG